MIVNFKKTTDTAHIPTKGTEYSAGADLYSVECPTDIMPGETKKIGTGIAVEIPEGYAGLVFARSGLSCKSGLAPANKVGVIDSDYRGEIFVFLHNHGDSPYTVRPGDRIAQIVFVPFASASFNEVDDLSETVRGEGGFGSTGTN